MSDNVKRLDNNAFLGCRNLVSITLSKQLNTIGSNAFAYCTSLQSINISKSVTTIGNYAFDYCDALKIINYGGTIAEWKALTNNINLGIKKYTVKCSDGDLSFE